MTNYEKWKLETSYREPNELDIVCYNSKCEDCPIYKHFKLCEGNESVVLKWLKSEVEEND